MLLLSPTTAPASAVLIAHTSAVSVSTNTAQTSGINTTGATGIVISGSWYTAGGPPTLSDSNANTWTLISSQANTFSPAFTTAMWYCLSPVVGAGHTFELAGTGIFASIQVEAFSGIESLDQSAGTNGSGVSGNTVQPGPITPTQNDELIVCCCGIDDASSGGGVYTVNDSLSVTDMNPFVTGGNYGGGLAWLLQSAATAIDPTWTVSGASIHGTGANAIIASFKTGAPTVNAVSPKASSNSSGLAVNGQTIATLTASNSPSSWAIVGGSGYFAVSSGGALTVTTTGAASIAPSGGGATYNAVVNATNAVGTSSNVTIPVTFYADGALSAPGGTAQYPTRLNGYTLRPAWKVAGVDYAVGPMSTPTSNPATSPPANTSYSSGLLRVSANNVIISGYDFTVDNGIAIYNPSFSNLMVVNCKFGGTNYATLSTGIIDNRGSGLTVIYCEIDGTSISSASLSWLIDVYGTGGTVTIQYNWLKNAPDEVISINGGGNTLNHQFNLVDNFEVESGGHTNTLQSSFSSGTLTITYNFNTIYQTTASGGQFVQLYNNGSSGGSPTVTNPNCNNNTMMAPGGSPGAIMSYMVNGPAGPPATTVVGTAVVNNNYIDQSGSDGPWYTGSSWVGVTGNGGYDMVSGGTLPLP